jgi:hypothetical protein
MFPGAGAFRQLGQTGADELIKKKRIDLELLFEKEVDMDFPYAWSGAIVTGEGNVSGCSCGTFGPMVTSGSLPRNVHTRRTRSLILKRGTWDFWGCPQSLRART